MQRQKWLRLLIMLIVIALTVAVATTVFPGQTAPEPRRGTIAPATVAPLADGGISGANAEGAWIAISGRQLIYRGQPILLRGANFANINALGARTDANNRIGTGRPQDVTIGLADYQKLREMGGNHARFGLDFYWYVKHGAAFWTMLDQQVNYAEQAGVWLVLLSFGNPSKNGTDSCYEGYSNPCDIWDSATDQQHLIDWWRAIVTRYKDRPTVAVIDPVNEPTVGASRNWSADYWWKLAERLRDNVVAINPNILVSIEAGSDAFFWRLLGKNVIYQAHYYTPLGGTHCPYNSGGVQYRYPGAAPLWDGSNPYFDKANLNNESAKASVYQAVPAIRWSQQNNVPLYIGEWGIATESCYPGGIQYMADVAELFNREGLHWAYYSWRASEQRWGTFPDRGALMPFSAAKYNMLITALADGGQQNPTPQPVTVAPPTATRTPMPPLPTNTLRTPTGIPTSAPTATRTRTPTRTHTSVVHTPVVPTPAAYTPTALPVPACSAGQVLIEISVEGRRLSFCAWLQ